MAVVRLETKDRDGTVAQVFTVTMVMPAGRPRTTPEPEAPPAPQWVACMRCSRPSPSARSALGASWASRSIHSTHARPAPSRGLGQCVVELLRGRDASPLRPTAAPGGVVPAGDVVEGAVDDGPLGAVAVVVEHEHDRVEPVRDGRRQVHAGHLEGAVAGEDDGAAPAAGQACARGGGDREPHAHVEAGDGAGAPAPGERP